MNTKNLEITTPAVGVSDGTNHKNDRHEYVFPPDLLGVAQESPPVFWTCVRVRRQWEKKFCRILRSQAVPHYMPVVPRHTYRGRKHRTAALPFFPGFVFVAGNHTKGSFTGSGCVVSILKPSCRRLVEDLDRQIKSIHRILSLGTGVGVAAQFAIGHNVTIESGPLNGLSGTITSTSNGNRLVVWVDMLGVGAFVHLETDTALRMAS